MYYFSWTLYSSIIVILLMTAGNWGVNSLWSWFNESAFKHNDKNTNLLTETINNIKSIKLNSYIDVFKGRLYEGRW